MSDIQELIYKVSMDCIEKGQRMEQDRVIRILTDKYSELTKSGHWAESNYFVEAIALIKRNDND